MIYEITIFVVAVLGFIIGVKWSESCSVPIIAKLLDLVRTQERHLIEIKKDIKELQLKITK